jgi:transposase
MAGGEIMLHLTFSQEDIKELDYQRYHHPHPRVQRKMEALLLKVKGLPHHQIASCVGVCENTVRSYFQQYQSGGIEALKRLEFRRPESRLEAYHDTIEAYFREHPATTIPQAVQCIEELTGIKRSPTQVGVFLKKLGLKRLKTSAIPAKCDVEQQATFKKTTWSPG